MKKIIALISVLAVILSFASCAAVDAGKDAVDASGSSDVSDTAETTASDASGEATTAAPITTATAYDNGMKETLDSLEYDIYYNFFYNKATAGYEDNERTLTGTFATILDKYNDVTRYYVWGYRDTTKCCCYQWEFVAPDGFEAPENGSVVTVKGTIKANDKALDGYWMEDCTVTVDEKYAGNDIDYDLTLVSPTLAYVQISNMLYDSQNNEGAAFNGKTVRIYGRAQSINTIQDPYYDNYWSLDFKGTETSPSIGEYIVLTGAFTAENGGGYVTASDVMLLD